MPFIISQKKYINYSVEGDWGAYIILHPPELESIESWYRLGYVEALAERFRLIMIDPIGQGRSDAPLEQSYYTMEARMEHILDVADEMLIDHFHFFGFGLGGQVGFTLAANYPERVRSLTIADAHPYPISSEMNEKQKLIDELKTNGIKPYLERLDADNMISAERYKDLMNGNPEAFALSLESSCQWQGIGEQLTSIHTPTLLITSTHEEKFLSIREAGRTLRFGRYLILPDIEYEDGLPKKNLIVPPMMDFLKRQRWSSRYNDG